MAKYRVSINEEFVHRLVVEASSEDKAIDMAYDLVGNVSQEILREENDYEFESSGFDGFHATVE